MSNKETNSKNIHAGHRYRVRQRFIKQGLSSFEDHQALELLLFYAFAQKDTNALAHALIDEFGSLHGVFDASVESLQKVKGVGENTAVLIKLIPEMYAKYLNSKAQENKLILDSPKVSGEYFVSILLNKTNENLVAAFLDNSLRVKKTEIISEGGISKTDVYLRKIVNSALGCNATRIVIAHNHPSGVAAPSAADIDAVRQMVKMFDKLELQLCDSIIVAGQNYFSMADHKKFAYLFD